LSILGRDLSKTIIVDNSPQAFAYHLENGIPIESWYKDPTDTELNKLEHYLKKISNQKIEDVRIELSEEFKLRDRFPPY
jgi:CTD small phosphatase-like protein 2